MGSFDWKRESDPPVGISWRKMFNFTIFLPSSWGDETRNSSSSLLFHKNLTEEETCRFFRGGEGYAGVCFYSRKESTVSLYVIVNPAGGVWNCLLEILSFSVFFGFSILNQIISGQLHRQRKLFSAGYTSYKCMDFWLDLVTDGVSKSYPICTGFIPPASP